MSGGSEEFTETYRWRLEDEAGQPLASEHSVPFPTQADAEAWFAESWEDLADLLLVRLESLGESARRVVRVAAVAGHEVSHELLAATTGIGDLLGIGLETEGQSWQERALCAQTDPEAFFPEKGGSTREAKRICQACAVRDECLEYALEHDERFGIWGGLSERERRKLKKRAV